MSKKQKIEDFTDTDYDDSDELSGVSKLVKVKPLKWERHVPTNGYCALMYVVFKHTDGTWRAEIHERGYSFTIHVGNAWFRTMKAAKNECQKHYDDSIYNLLEVR